MVKGIREARGWKSFVAGRLLFLTCVSGIFVLSDCGGWLLGKGGRGFLPLLFLVLFLVVGINEDTFAVGEREGVEIVEMLDIEGFVCSD